MNFKMSPSLSYLKTPALMIIAAQKRKTFDFINNANAQIYSFMTHSFCACLANNICLHLSYYFK